MQPFQKCYRHFHRRVRRGTQHQPITKLPVERREKLIAPRRAKHRYAGEINDDFLVDRGISQCRLIRQPALLSKGAVGEERAEFLELNNHTEYVITAIEPNTVRSLC